MSNLKLIPYQPDRVESEDSRNTLQGDFMTASARRSVRMFSTDPVPRDLIETAIKIAGTAPSGAHQQP